MVLEEPSIWYCLLSIFLYYWRRSLVWSWERIQDLRQMQLSFRSLLENTTSERSKSTHPRVECGQTQSQLPWGTNREPFYAKEDEYSLVGAGGIFSESGLAPPSHRAGEFLAICGSHQNCYGMGRHDFYYVNSRGERFFTMLKRV